VALDVAATQVYRGFDDGRCWMGAIILCGVIFLVVVLLAGYRQHRFGNSDDRRFYEAHNKEPDLKALGGGGGAGAAPGG
jgi:hypothetical protein